MRKRVLALVLAAAFTGCAGATHAVPVTNSAPANAIPLAGVKFFVKGVAYSPAPIGKTVGDAPLLDDPLRDGNQAIWARDLAKMRAIGVNAIHVYNVVGPPDDARTGPISKFLTAAYNGGKQPIYVLMSLYFTGDKLLDGGATANLAKKYHDLDAKYAKSPAILGITISNEIGTTGYIQNKTWWKNFNVVANAARKGFADGGGTGKIVTTSEIDGDIAVVKFGEQNGAAVDVWGVNIYRGRTFTNLFEQIRQYTKKPVLVTEWGASAAYHPGWKNTYSWQNTANGAGVCSPATPKGTTTAKDVAELPASGNPKMAGLVDLIQNDASQLYGAWKKNGVVSGGFYFEWNDEWWKAGTGDPSVHYGNVAFKNYFPGCNDDQGWYGLNAVKKNGNAVDILQPRAGLTALQQTWAKQP